MIVVFTPCDTQLRLHIAANPSGDWYDGFGTNGTEIGWGGGGGGGSLTQSTIARDGLRIVATKN